MSQEDNDAPEVDEGVVVREPSLPFRGDPPEVLEPGEEPLDFPPPLVAPEGPAVLRLRFPPRIVRGNDLASVPGFDPLVVPVGVVGPVPDEPPEVVDGELGARGFPLGG